MEAALDAVAAAGRMADLADKLLAVRSVARADGATWEEIAERLGRSLGRCRSGSAFASPGGRDPDHPGKGVTRPRARSRSGDAEMLRRLRQDQDWQAVPHPAARRPTSEKSAAATVEITGAAELESPRKISNHDGRAERTRPHPVNTSSAARGPRPTLV